MDFQTNQIKITELKQNTTKFAESSNSKIITLLSVHAEYQSATEKYRPTQELGVDNASWQDFVKKLISFGTE